MFRSFPPKRPRVILCVDLVLLRFRMDSSYLKEILTHEVPKDITIGIISKDAN
jgi:hypothetical protein